MDNTRHTKMLRTTEYIPKKTQMISEQKYNSPIKLSTDCSNS
uniref:Uncharacterized protein n=1 Tax=Arundo donax TaxID=35708 RepID=A0A0A9C6Q7_ARUDO